LTACPVPSRDKITFPKEQKNGKGRSKIGKRRSKTGKRRSKTGKGCSKTEKDVPKQGKDVLKQEIIEKNSFFSMFFLSFLSCGTSRDGTGQAVKIPSRPVAKF
jgi:hypothetical protein